MKSLLHHIFLLLIAMLSITACSDIDPFETDETRGMELTINCVNPNNTRATMPGDNAYNENAIRTIHYFLYVSGKTNENAVMKGKINIAVGTNGTATIRIPMNEAELNNVVFPRPIEECEVYLIANLPDGVRPAGAADDDPKNWTNTTLATLRAMSVTANFQGDAVQTSFVMEGLGKARIISRNKTVAAEGNIIIERLASKITSRIAVAESFTDADGKVWVPQVNDMQIHLDNAVSSTTLNADFGTTYFDYDERTALGTANGTLGEGGESVLFHVYQPFYSYPCTWDYSDDEAMALYVKLPWRTDNGDGTPRFETCHYKVYLPTMQLDRNYWYNLDLKIDMLGTFTAPDEPVEVTGVIYKVIDWKNGFADWSAGLNIDTELLSAHYLVVEQNNFVVNNKNTFEIPFITSHKCVIEDVKMTYVSFGSSDTSKPTDSPITTSVVTPGTHYKINDGADDWLKLDGNVIKFKHVLNNDFVNTKDYDYSPFTITFTLCHENNKEKFKEKITIVQKPAISITAHLNSLREYSNSNTNGYMYINGTTGKDGGNGADYGGAHGLTGSNTNPYMYTIEVTVLPAGSDYILGDPRTDTPATDSNRQGLDFGDFVNAPGIEGTNSRKLQNYYGTKTDESVQNMLAPKFRIASSHGVTNQISHTNARNRAATYQEDGYPAGRWRVPTMAEVTFMVKLSSDGKIPTLFSNGSAYWCANGKVTPQAGGGVDTTVGTEGNNGPVRCVYDDWYWENSRYPRMAERGNHPNKYNQFTWGDEI